MELALLHFFLLGKHLLFIKFLLSFLNQRQHIAHAENSAGHTVRMKLLKTVQLFADTGEFDGDSSDRANTERRTTAGVAVELREDHTVEFERFVERFGTVDCVLPGHGVADEQAAIRDRRGCRSSGAPS